MKHLRSLFLYPSSSFIFFPSSLFSHLLLCFFLIFSSLFLNFLSHGFIWLWGSNQSQVVLVVNLHLVFCCLCRLLHSLHMQVSDEEEWKDHCCPGDGDGSRARSSARVNLRSNNLEKMTRPSPRRPNEFAAIVYVFFFIVFL